MQADMPFWIAAIVLALGVAGVVLAPMMRGKARAERRASYDMQVYRDQLREVDADVARGVLSVDEAAAVRVEISRRLLGAADAETVEAATHGAPSGVSRAAAIGVAIALVAATGGLYAALGAPGRPDEPLGARLSAIAEQRANRPSQTEVEAIAAASGLAGRPEDGAPTADQPGAEALAADGSATSDRALVDRLRSVLAERPDDVEGHRLLAKAEASLGNWPEARAAQERLVELLGATARPEDRVDLAEFMIIAANGYVSPQAESALTQALEAAPENQVARYYSGLALAQNGRPDLALQLWTRLMSEGPTDAPWMPLIAAQIDEVALLAGAPVPEAPAQTGAVAPEAMSEAERTEMISGMVSQLSDRLAKDGGTPDEWAQLIRSLGVLGRTDEAEAIFREAHETFAADPAALALLRDTAKAAGVAE